MERIKAPVYGFYGGNDARIDATIPETKENMKAAGKTYDPVIYEGAGHGFMRAGEDPAGMTPTVRRVGCVGVLEAAAEQGDVTRAPVSRYLLTAP